MVDSLASGYSSDLGTFSDVSRFGVKSQEWAIQTLVGNPMAVDSKRHVNSIQ